MKKSYVKINDTEYLGYSTLHHFYFAYSTKYYPEQYKHPVFKGDTSLFTDAEIDFFIQDFDFFKNTLFKDLDVKMIKKVPA
jgi:hypothetical protein